MSRRVAPLDNQKVNAVSITEGRKAHHSSKNGLRTARQGSLRFGLNGTLCFVALDARELEGDFAIGGRSRVVEFAGSGDSSGADMTNEVARSKAGFPSPGIACHIDHSNTAERVEVAAVLGKERRC